MPELILEYPYEDTKYVVKTAFENTRSIKKYHDSGSTIVGKTGMSIASYGEQIIVDLHESPSEDDRTKITVRSEKEVSMNITANPQKHESAFLSSLNDLRGRNIQEIKDIAANIIEKNNGTNEIVSNEGFTGAGSKVIAVIILTSLMFFLFFLFL